MGQDKMSEQKPKKKLTAADLAMIGFIFSFGMPVLLFGLSIIWGYFGIQKFIQHLPIFKSIDHFLDVSVICLFLASILTMPFSFIAGVIGLINSIKKKANFSSYLKSSLGIIMLVPLLIAFAMPQISSRHSAARAKQSEAKQNLEQIYDAYSAYHKKHHTYPNAPSMQSGETIFDCLQVAGWKPRGNIRYNYNCMNTEVFSPGEYPGNYPCPPEVVTQANQNSFIVAACGNVDADSTVDVWTIDDAKHLRNVVDDVKK
jgi:hypothetical protein